MSARIERTAAVKAQIARAVGELEHGDPTAAINALTAGLTNMLELMVEQDEVISRITLKLENDYKGIDALLHRLEEQMAIHPKGEEVKEPEPTAAGQEVRQVLDTLRGAEPTKIKRR